jgi:trans-aconitate methyltransferase
VKDYCDWIADDLSRLDHIERAWKKNPEMHDGHARDVLGFVAKNQIKSVVEIGCGSGMLAQRISAQCAYVGFDKSVDLLTLAQNRNAKLKFVMGDVREIPSHVRGDLVVCFGFMKHFAATEWNDIFSRVLACGEQYAIIEIPNPGMHYKEELRGQTFISDEYDTSNNKFEFPHVWVSLSYFVEVANAHRFKVMDVYQPDSVEPTYVFKRIA